MKNKKNKTNPTFIITLNIDQLEKVREVISTDLDEWLEVHHRNKYKHADYLKEQVKLNKEILNITLDALFK